MAFKRSSVLIRYKNKVNLWRNLIMKVYLSFISFIHLNSFIVSLYWIEATTFFGLLYFCRWNKNQLFSLLLYASIPYFSSLETQALLIHYTGSSKPEFVWKKDSQTTIIMIMNVERREKQSVINSFLSVYFLVQVQFRQSYFECSCLWDVMLAQFIV